MIRIYLMAMVASLSSAACGNGSGGTGDTDTAGHTDDGGLGEVMGEAVSDVPHDSSEGFLLDSSDATQPEIDSSNDGTGETDTAGQETVSDVLHDSSEGVSLDSSDATQPEIDSSNCGIDCEAPTWSESATLKASNVGPSQIWLNWGSEFGEAAVDNVGVTEFAVYQDGEIVGIVDEDTFFYNPDGIQPDTVYTFQIQAGDAAGNWSTDGPTVEVKTQCPTYWEDKCPASWPADAVLTVAKTDDGDVKLSWTPAYDNMEVVGYRVLQDGECLCLDFGVPESNYTVDGDTTQYVVSDLSPGATYHFQVSAKDSVSVESGGGGWIPGPETYFTFVAP